MRAQHDRVNQRIASAKERRVRLRERLKERAKGQGASKRRRRRATVAALILFLLLAMLQDCSCGPAPALEVPVIAVQVEPPVQPLTGRNRRLDRPEYATPAPRALPWIDAFRMQVAARSPRLARCFVHADRPGQLKWTTSVELTNGRVSEHLIEPMLSSIELNRSERECVLGVLEEPPYDLPREGARSTASRVGLVIEF